MASEISAIGGPLILANRCPFACALREGYNREWDGEVNDHPGRESPIHVVSSQKGQVLKGLEEKRRLLIKKLKKTNMVDKRSVGKQIVQISMRYLKNCSTL
ncbi:hypothetical protein AVEN_103020-1 [Araneus ventricosus]|uniref:Uncharacterized protein n=1 Tax=Araneus ventricosus TaxID=182803 RepID=A0A4Y2BAA8_ARAVE|nr:hypothetical protein AVEN_103020-1 [Araneus ventricosus]